MSKTHISRHARDRIDERLGFSKSAQRMADKAFAHGLRHADLNGSLNRFVSALFLEHRNANNTRIYGHNVYLFAGSTLVTVIMLPNQFRRAAEKIAARKRNYHQPA